MKKYFLPFFYYIFFFTGLSAQISTTFTDSISDFNQGHIYDTYQLLEGKTLGLQLAKAGSDPNGAYENRLLGAATLNPYTAPLIVVDGLPFVETMAIDPLDIERIHILRGAAATAKYGILGGTGVIEITTKSGTQKGASVAYNAYVSASNAINTPDMLTAEEYRNINNPNLASRIVDFGDATDWIGEVTRTGISQAHHLALNNNTDKQQLYASFSFREVNGVAQNSGFGQLNGRLRLNQSALNDKVNLSIGLATLTRNMDNVLPHLFRYAMNANPTLPIQDGNEQYGGYAQRLIFDAANPVAMLHQIIYDQRIQYNVAQAKASINLVNNTSLDLHYGINQKRFNTNQYFSKTDFLRGAALNGVASKTANQDNNQYFESALNYKNTFGQIDLTTRLGYAYQQFTEQGLSAEGYGFITDAFTYHNLGAAAAFNNGLGRVNTYKSRSNYASFFLNTQADIDDTYFISLNYRQDGSSRLGPDNRWGAYYGVSLFADFSKIINIPEVSIYPKISYGTSGILPTDNHLYRQLYGQGTVILLNGDFVPGFQVVQLGNPNLGAEQVSQFNIGADFSIFNQLVDASIDYYFKKTDEMILPIVSSPIAYENYGELTNSGFNLSISYPIVAINDFNWHTTFNLSTFNTRVGSLANSVFDPNSAEYIGNLGAPGGSGFGINIFGEDMPLGQVVGYNFIEINNNGYSYEDIDGDGITAGDDDDIIVLGSGLPKAAWGWSNRMTFGQFTIDALFLGHLGHTLINAPKFYYGPPLLGSYNMFAATLDSEIAEAYNDFPHMSQLFAEKANYFRLDNLTVNYKIPLETSAKFKEVSIFITGHRLFEITKYSGMDATPRFSHRNDTRVSGVEDRTTYYPQRSFVIGLKVN